MDQGICCVIAPSFADIFHNNSYKNGLLPLILPREDCEALAAEAGGANHRFTIGLEAQTVTAPSGAIYRFDIDPGRKALMLAGLDEIGQSLASAEAISQYEITRRLSFPWLDRTPAS
jgi:3-isopropylmalate dehydratase small subunit